jgi:hypothetical protein
MSTTGKSSSPLLETMKANGIPLTRENYLNLAYPDGVPDPMPAELEGEIPLDLRTAIPPAHKSDELLGKMLGRKAPVLPMVNDPPEET